MKSLLYAAALFTAITSSYLYGQSQDLVATVPFKFRVGEKVMPAGSYQVKESQGLLTIREKNGKAAVMHLIMPVARPSASSNASLEFTRYGSDYYLAKIWSGHSNDGQALTQGRRERELAERYRIVETAAIPLQQDLR